MRRNISRIKYWVVILSLILLVTNACGIKTNSQINSNANNKSERTISDKNKISIQNNSITKINIDELKAAIKTAINNDIWYSGVYSNYNGFESQKSKFEIYMNPKFPDSVTILFNKRFKHGKYSIYEDEEFYAVDFWKGDKGYSDQPSGSIEEIGLARIKERLKELGLVYYTSSEIEFGKTTQPVFPKLTDTKEKIVDEIEDKIVERLKLWEKTGTYKVYIRNFKENNYNTYAVIEDAKGKMWVLEIALEENGFIGTGKFLEAGVDVDEYTANQYKKVSFEREVNL
ncbi:MAG: hypothetical protein ACM3UU_10015 [Ignavibacteriales bacterium]